MKRNVCIVLLAILIAELLVGISGVVAAKENISSNDGYVTVSEAISYDCTNMDIWIAKTDTDGNEEWNKTFETSGSEFAESVQQTSDGGYVILGSVCLFPGTPSRILLIKTDADGNEEWNKTFGSGGWVYGNSAKQTSDGGYIIVGEQRCSNPPKDCLVWLIKTDINGTEIWDRTLSESSCWEYNWSVEQTDDGGYIIEGVNCSGHIRTIRIDAEKAEKWSERFKEQRISNQKQISKGNEEWNKTFRGDTWAYYCSIKQTSDGGYISKGYLNCIVGRELYKVDLIVKIDANGNEEWRTVSAPIRRPQTTQRDSQPYISTP